MTPDPLGGVGIAGESGWGLPGRTQSHLTPVMRTHQSFEAPEGLNTTMPEYSGREWKKSDNNSIIFRMNYNFLMIYLIECNTFHRSDLGRAAG
jgi:hypothetical protein